MKYEMLLKLIKLRLLLRARKISVCLTWLCQVAIICNFRLAGGAEKKEISEGQEEEDHKVEMQWEVKPVDCWLRSDPGNLGLPSTASQ